MALLSTNDPNAQLEQRKHLHLLSNFVASANSFDELLPGAQARMLELFSAERTTIFAVDTKNRQLYSLIKSGGEFKRDPRCSGAVVDRRLRRAFEEAGQHRERVRSVRAEAHSSGAPLR